MPARDETRPCDSTGGHWDQRIEQFLQWIVAIQPTASARAQAARRLSEWLNVLYDISSEDVIGAFALSPTIGREIGRLIICPEVAS